MARVTSLFNPATIFAETSVSTSFNRKTWTQCLKIIQKDSFLQVFGKLVMRKKRDIIFGAKIQMRHFW